MACGSCGKKAEASEPNGLIQVMDEDGNMVEVFPWQIQYNDDGTMEVAKSLFADF